MADPETFFTQSDVKHWKDLPFVTASGGGLAKLREVIHRSWNAEGNSLETPPNQRTPRMAFIGDSNAVQNMAMLRTIASVFGNVPGFGGMGFGDSNDAGPMTVGDGSYGASLQGGYSSVAVADASVLPGGLMLGSSSATAPESVGGRPWQMFEAKRNYRVFGTRVNMGWQFFDLSAVRLEVAAYNHAGSVGAEPVTVDYWPGPSASATAANNDSNHKITDFVVQPPAGSGNIYWSYRTPTTDYWHLFQQNTTIPAGWYFDTQPALTEPDARPGIPDPVRHNQLWHMTPREPGLQFNHGRRLKPSAVWPAEAAWKPGNLAAFALFGNPKGIVFHMFSQGGLSFAGFAGQASATEDNFRGWGEAAGFDVIVLAFGGNYSTVTPAAETAVNGFLTATQPNVGKEDGKSLIQRLHDANPNALIVMLGYPNAITFGGATGEGLNYANINYSAEEAVARFYPDYCISINAQKWVERKLGHCPEYSNSKGVFNFPFTGVDRIPEFDITGDYSVGDYVVVNNVQKYDADGNWVEPTRHDANVIGQRTSRNRVVWRCVANSPDFKSGGEITNWARPGGSGGYWVSVNTQGISDQVHFLPEIHETWHESLVYTLSGSWPIREVNETIAPSGVRLGNRIWA